MDRSAIDPRRSIEPIGIDGSIPPQSLAAEATLRRMLSRILVRDARAHGIDIRER
ncbi:MAG: hypothetical protein AAF560_29915 [Acidobacteriota bacterium]